MKKPLMRLVAAGMFAIVVTACGQGTPEPIQPSADEKALLQNLAVLHGNGRFEEGLTLARAYLNQHPGAPEVYHAVAVFQGSLGQHHAAIASFKKELELNPGHLGSYQGLAQTQSTLGHHEEALTYAMEAHRLAPDNPRVIFQLGSLLSTLGRFDEAEVHLLRARLELDTPAVDTELALVSQRRGDPEEAARRFRQVLAKDPQYLPALHGLAQTLLRLGQQEEGEQLLAYHQRRTELLRRSGELARGCYSGTGSVNSCVELARVHLMLGGDEPARKAFEKALEIDQENFTAALGLGALLIRSEEFELASKWTVQALALAPSHPRPLFQLGLLRVHKGEHEAAGLALDASRKAAAWTVENFVFLGDAWFTVGEYERAQKTYDDGLKLDEAHPTLLLGLGRSQMSAGDVTEAEATLRRLLQSRPNQQAAWLLLATALANQGDTEGANQAFETAITTAGPAYGAESARRRLLEQLQTTPGGTAAAEMFRHS